MAVNNASPSITRKQLAPRFNVHIETLKRWDKRGLITPIKIPHSGQVRYATAEIEALESKGFEPLTEEERGNLNCTFDLNRIRKERETFSPTT